MALFFCCVSACSETYSELKLDNIFVNKMYIAKCLILLSISEIILGEKKKEVNIFAQEPSDEPKSFSQAFTDNPSTSRRPTVEQMKYYNYFSAAMYCPSQLKDLSCKYCQKFKKHVSKFKLLSNKTTLAMALVSVSNERSEIVVTHRGTTNFKNIGINADLTMVNPGGSEDIKVHRGFYNATMSLYQSIVKFIADQIVDKPEITYRIVLTGHSLGGSMSAILQYLLIQKEAFPEADYTLITFGEGRDGNKAFVDFMNAQNITTARVVNRADFAAHNVHTNHLNTTHPHPETYYLHRQTEYWINGTEEKFCNTLYYEDPQCSDSFETKYELGDHFHYFDVNYETCMLEQPLQFLESKK